MINSTKEKICVIASLDELSKGLGLPAPRLRGPYTPLTLGGLPNSKSPVDLVGLEFQPRLGAASRHLSRVTALCTGLLRSTFSVPSAIDLARLNRSRRTVCTVC